MTTLPCRIAGALLGLTMTAGIAAVVSATQAQASSVVNGQITRSEVIARAQTWLNQGIPYDQGGLHPDPQGKLYRTDCSGYVSMAWHLDHSRVTYGGSTENLADPSISDPISKDQLKAGDLMMASGQDGHAVLFEGWTDSSHNHYSAYEFGSTPVSHPTSIPYPYWPNDGRTFKPYHYRNVIDDTVGGPVYQLHGDTNGWHNDSTALVLTNVHSLSTVDMGGTWPQALANENGTVYQIFGDGGGWHNASTGISVPTNTTVSAVNMGGAWPQALANENGTVYQIYADAQGWHNAPTGISVPTNTTVSAINMGGTWPQALANENGTVYQVYADGQGWHNAPTGIAVPTDTTVSAVNMGGGWPQALANENGTVYQLFADGQSWHNASTAISVPTNTTVSAINMGGAWPQALANENGAVYQLFADTHGWHNTSTGIGVPTDTTVSAVNVGDGRPQALAVE